MRQIYIDRRRHDIHSETLVKQENAGEQPNVIESVSSWSFQNFRVLYVKGYKEQVRERMRYPGGTEETD